MGNGSQFGAAACVNVGGRTNNDAGNGETADQATDHVANSLSPQFAVGRGVTFQWVELFSSLHIQQGFYRSHNGDGARHNPYLFIGNSAEIGHGKLSDEIPEALCHGQAYEVALRQCQTAVHAYKQDVQQCAGYNGHEGSRDNVQFRYFAPIQDDQYRKQCNKRCPQVDMVNSRKQGCKAVVAIYLDESKVALRVFIISKGM